MAGSDAMIDEGGIPQVKPLLRMGGGSLKPLVREAETGTEPGLRASQAMHLSFSGLLSMVHIEQVQVPAALVGSLSPAAAQLNPTGAALTGAGAGMSGGIGGDVGTGARVGTDVVAPGLGASQTEHLLNISFVLQLQRVQVHSPATGVLGFRPAATQLNSIGAALTGAGVEMSAGIGGDIGAGAEVGADAAAPGLGASQMEHLLNASFVLQLQTVQVHSPATGVLGFNPAAAQLKATGLTGAGAAEGVDAGLEGAGVTRAEVAGASAFDASQTEH